MFAVGNLWTFGSLRVPSAIFSIVNLVSGRGILSSGSTCVLLLADFSLEVSGPTSFAHCSRPLILGSKADCFFLMFFLVSF